MSKENQTKVKPKQNSTENNNNNKAKKQNKTKTNKTRNKTGGRELLLFVGCLMPQQHASVSRGRICSDKFTCCHTEIQVADQTFHLTRSQYTDTGSTSPSTDPITPGAWQGSHWSVNFLSHWYDSTPKNPGASGIRTRDLPLSRRTP